MKKQDHKNDQSNTELESIGNIQHISQVILDNAYDLIAIHRLVDLSYEYVNPATTKILGYSKKELLNKSALEFIHPDDRERILHNINDKAPIGVGQEEFRYLKKDGSYIWLEGARYILPRENQDNAIIIISRDITDRKQAESNLIDSEVHFRTFFEKAPFAMSINRNGRILFANRAYVTMFGHINNEELVGNLVTSQIAPGCRREISSNIKRRKKGEEIFVTHETVGLRKDGSTFPLFMQFDNILLPDGPANVIFFTDTTSLEKAKEALQSQLKAQALLLDISMHTTDMIDYNIDAMINLTLQKISQYYNNDRSYIFMLSKDGSTMSNTHEWCAEGISAEIDNLQNIPVDFFPRRMVNLQKGECLYIHRVADLPPEAQAQKDFLQAQSIQSLIVVPMFLDDKRTGYLGFDYVRREKSWSKENILILESVAQLIVQSLQRNKYAQDLHVSKHYHRTILEKTGSASMILEEDLTISLANKECETVLGCSNINIIGASLLDFIPENKVEMIKEYNWRRRIDPAAVPNKYKIGIINKQGDCRDGYFIVDIIPYTRKSILTFIDLTEFKRINRALRAICAVNGSIMNAQDQKELLYNVCNNIVKIGGYNLVWVGYLVEDQLKKVKPIAFAGLNSGYLAKLNIALHDSRRGQGPVGNAIRTGLPVVSREFKKDETFKPWVKDALKRGFKSCMAVPLKANDITYGVLSIYSNNKNAFDQEEENLLLTMGNNLAYAINSLRVNIEKDETSLKLEKSLEKMKRIMMQAVTSLGTTLSIKDPYTAGHQTKVVRLATAIAEEMGYSHEQLEGISVAGNLHDIGKINIPSEILSKPGKLSKIEFAHIKTHSRVGYRIVKNIEFPWQVAEVLLQHHERMDGSGYPRGLVGEEILKEARIMAVADVVEAMASHRPYRPALGVEKALEEIELNQGILYDPDVVDVCLKLFREKGFKLE